MLPTANVLSDLNVKHMKWQALFSLKSTKISLSSAAGVMRNNKMDNFGSLRIIVLT